MTTFQVQLQSESWAHMQTQARNVTISESLLFCKISDWNIVTVEFTTCKDGARNLATKEQPVQAQKKY
jgi:hypothetical protein